MPFSLNLTQFSERRQFFSEFTMKKETVFTGSMLKLRQEMTTDMALEVSSTFYLSTQFDGNYSKDCGMTLNIMDLKQEPIFHLDFRFNMKNRYRRLVRASKYNGEWTEGDYEVDLPDLAKENGIYVLVTEESFLVTVNKILLEPNFPVNLERLFDYDGIMLNFYGHCVAVDLTRSYMTNGGKCACNNVT